MKKFAVIFMALVLSVTALTACSDTSGQNSVSSDTAVSQISESDNSMFADGDYKNVADDGENATITLSGGEGTISDTTRGSSGSEVTITSKGTYRVTGSSENVTINIDDDTQSGNIYLILDNVTMKNTENACINVKACDKLIIQCVGENTLTYSSTDTSAKIDGAIYSKDDVTINGDGTLNVTSNMHGIVCNEDMKVTGAKLNVTAESIGIKAENSFKMDGGTVSVQSGHDGIQLSNDDNNSYFYMSDGTLTINADYDGISVKAGDSSATFTGYVELAGGTAEIISGGGSVNSKSDTSQKGIKCDGDIKLGDIKLTVSSADDAVHGNASITVDSGDISLSSSDDGMTASGTITVNNGTLDISKSYEGIEAETVIINDGKVSVISSDDGINSAGGSDTNANDENMWSESSSGNITINGGYIYVNASGDGLDSNGSIYVTGGTTIVEGSTTGGNGALDNGDGRDCVASITGGTVLALGTTDMAVNFDTGTQCSALVDISGTGDTEITVDDGSDFKFTATKNFACAVYSSPSMTQGNSYTLTAGTNTATLDFSSDLYYSNVQSMGRGGFGR